MRKTMTALRQPPCGTIFGRNRREDEDSRKTGSPRATRSNKFYRPRRRLCADASAVWRKRVGGGGGMTAQLTTTTHSPETNSPDR